MNVREFLTRSEVEFEVLPHIDTYDAQHMAHELHISGHQVAKTVLLRANGGYRYYVVVLPASTRIDMNLLRSCMGGGQLALATEAELAEHCPDCEAGALPPFGSFYGMQTILDRALLDNDWIIFEGNTHRESIRMRLSDFLQLESPLITDFAVGPRSHQW